MNHWGIYNVTYLVNLLHFKEKRMQEYEILKSVTIDVGNEIITGVVIGYSEDKNWPIIKDSDTGEVLIYDPELYGIENV